jgi:phosphoglycolate phosphatase
MLNKPEGILFDLDGTFADTAPDLAYALNQTLIDSGLDTLPFDKIRPVVSHGGKALIKLGFNLPEDSEAFEERRQHLLQVYLNNLSRETTLFEGIEEVLEHIETQNIAWGIVTNKPDWLTDPLMLEMGFTHRTKAIVSGNTCARAKPHPDSILHACNLLKIDPRNTWYVGDAGRDMQAGRSAGNQTIGATYGYIYDDDPIAAWGADVLINQPVELIDLIQSANA